ncbi:MAG: hypothetical protein GY790_10330 [Bacteroidetes bacterium]|nr:hypothetical protein [Bacteroidota bacterium]
MKICASILVVSMVFLGLNRFMEALDWMAPQTELSCDMDCCSQQTEGCEDYEGCEDEQGEENPCNCDCNCSPSIQIVAIGYHFPTSFELVPKAFDHGSYRDDYQSEYLSPHFQPPRIA